MAAYHRVYDSHHLQADCQEPRSAPESYARQSSMGYYFFVLVCLITGSRSTLKKKQFEISMNDRVSVFIELADAYRQLGQQVWTSGLLPPHR